MSRVLLALAVLTGGLGLSAARAEKAPPPDRQPGQLDVFDDAKLFSPAGVQKAKEKLRETEFHHGLAVTVDTMTEVPEAKKAAAEAAAASKDAAKWRAFMLDWARETAKADRAKGVYVLVTLKPVGGVAVIADRETTQRGFTEADDAKVREIIAAALHEAKEKGKTEPEEAKLQEIRSAGLLKAVEYIAADLKDTRVADAAGHEKAGDHRGGPAHPAPQQHPAGSPIGGYICMGLFMLAGVWIVIALIRMFTGGGGGGGPGGGGGGGGGFMSSMLGGLFGAAAGMWMYNHFFGGGGGMFGGGGDAYANDGGVGGGDVGGGDTGAGDWGGGSGDAGGFDGGGGDFGGGGDLGGGDFGGGGGDFGGDF